MQRGLICSAMALLLGSCGQSPAPSAVNGAVNQASDEARPQQVAGRPFTVSAVASFGSPWAMDFLRDAGGKSNLALVSEREGRLWLVDMESGQKRAVAGVPQVIVAGQGGLGDVVVHPQFARNKRVYLSFAEAGPNGTSGAALGYGTLVLGEQPRIDDFKVIWRQTPKVDGNGHFSHRVAFAPNGSIFLSSGDRQKMDPAQDPGSDLGKILHLTAEGEPAPGNPWADRGGRQAMYWSTGHRNVLGLDFAPDGRLWASEMGPKGGDELNLILPGQNYGWPRVSYGSHYSNAPIPDAHAGRGFEEPKAWWTPSISPGGLLIYSGDLFRGWKGDAFLPALSGQALLRVEIEGDRARKADQWDMGNRIRAVEQGPRGEIYLLEDGRNGPARLLRLEPAGRS